MLIFGSARRDENGKYSNGKPGDQDNQEVSTQSLYLHSKGWYILRAIDPSIQKKLAYAMNAACDNNHFGYSQSDRMSGYNAASKVNFDPTKVTTDVNIDCSELVRVCLAYAGIKVQDFSTYNEKSVLESTGKFYSPISVTNLSQCQNGDILVTKTKGHTGICIEQSSKNKNLIEIKISTSKKGLRVIGTKQLNIRKGPGTNYEIVGTLKKDEYFKPVAKILVDDEYWFKISANKYVVSTYCYGWIQETTCNNQWWYVEQGYNYDSDCISLIDNNHYCFDSNGWLITSDRIDSSGAIKGF